MLLVCLGNFYIFCHFVFVLVELVFFLVAFCIIDKAADSRNGDDGCTWYDIFNTDGRGPFPSVEAFPVIS